MEAHINFKSNIVS